MKTSVKAADAYHLHIKACAIRIISTGLLCLAAMNSGTIHGYAQTNMLPVLYSENSDTANEESWEKQSNGTWKYRLKSGDTDYAVSCWIQDGGKWYHFDENGIMQTDCFITDNGKSYYLRPDGAMGANEVCIVDGTHYSFDADGNYHTTWYQNESGSIWKYTTPEGGYVTNDWKEVNGKYYHFDSNGIMQTGLLTLDGKTYYLQSDGARAVNETLTIDGARYTFDKDGVGTKEQTSSNTAVSDNTASVNIIMPDSTHKETADNSASASNTDNGSAQASAWPYKAITQVPSESEKSAEYLALDQMCDSILTGIVNNNMTKRQKAEAIYAYVRGHFTYSGHSATRDWVHEAYQGLRSKHGDCYTYYAASQALLTRVGINCIEVIRSKDNDHWWELVELEDGWWHFDTTPRKVGGYYCLWSDAQMDAFSAVHGNCFAFDHSLYPSTP